MASPTSPALPTSPPPGDTPSIVVKPTEEDTEEHTEEKTEKHNEEPTEEYTEEHTEGHTEEDTEENTEEKTEEHNEVHTEEHTEEHTEGRTGSSDDEEHENVTEEGTLSEKDPAELEEEERIKTLKINVKTHNPYDDGSEIKRAVKTENCERLEYLMDLGEFDVDRSSRMAKLLSMRGQSGLNLLAALCVELSAPQCMMALIRWAKNPDHSYWINEKVLFQHAKKAALKGNMVCCIELMKQKIWGGQDYNDMIDLANELYPHVRSIELGAKLAKFMYGRLKNIFFYPHLVYHCSILGIQPALVAMSITLIIKAGDSFDVPGFHLAPGITKVPIPDDGKRRAPLSEAARVLNTDIVRLLTHNTLIIDNLHYIVKNWEKTAEYNPLFTLVKQEFPFLAPATHTRSEEEEEETKLITHPDDKQVYFQLHRAGHAMLECLKQIKTRIRDMENYKSSDYADMYQTACDIYTATIRELTIRQIRRHLPLKAQAKLIELKPEPVPEDQKTPTQATHQPDEPKTPTQAEPQPEKESSSAENNNNSDDGTNKYKFLDSINGTFLRKTLEDYDIELHPVFTTEIWTYLVEYENVKTMERKIRSKVQKPKIVPSSAVLYEYVLDPDSRTTTLEYTPRSSLGSSASDTGGDTTTDDDDDDDGRGLRGSWTGIVGSKTGPRRFGPGGGYREFIPSSTL